MHEKTLWLLLSTHKIPSRCLEDDVPYKVFRKSLESPVLRKVQKTIGFIVFSFKKIEKTIGFTVCSFKKVEKPLVLLRVRSKRLKNHWFYRVLAQTG